MFPHVGIVALAALVPLIMGFIYYNPKVIGTAWMKEAEMTEEKMKNANMLMIFALSFIFAFFLGFMLFGLVVHQTDFYSLLASEEGFMVPGSETTAIIDDVMAKYGNHFRTFKHGALHGTLIGVFVVFPIFATNAMFERKTWKYTFINTGYWIITLALMGGVLCQWG